MDSDNSAAEEFAAIKKIHDELHPLAEDARARVLSYLINLLQIEVAGHPVKTREFNEREEVAAASGAQTLFDTFAELFDAANPTTNADKALVAGYWLQEHEGLEGFDSQSANSLLKNLGYGIQNVTAALTSLKEQKPALVLQLKKSGTSQQARKTYKVTVAGNKLIRQLIEGGSEA
ncbi:hypothetical protein WNY37_07950 [Henriciella sp. AS95]|uniref:hypothetical protein n=1 Tax=Henriciella sp. AS95 TaxID=3135782 RepID=UPI00316BA514